MVRVKRCFWAARETNRLGCVHPLEGTPRLCGRDVLKRENRDIWCIFGKRPEILDFMRLSLRSGSGILGVVCSWRSC
jgi:hypothetical protein